MATKTEKNVQLKINKMTKNIFDQLSVQGLISEDELYLLPEDEEKDIQQQVDEIEAKIPSAATSENQLADKAFVNSSINNYAAFYLTKNANGDAFETHGEMLLTGTYWNAGVQRIPTKNDYLIVLEDETKTTALGVKPTTRYVYQGEWPTGQFEFQYIVNNTALTQAQVDAINSGITKSIVDKMVVPSSTNPGYAANSDFALTAETANTALTANYAEQSETANTALTANYAEQSETANTALTANYAEQSETANTALTANYAEQSETANSALSANSALTADYAPNYTPLSTFNETLGDLSSIIHEI